MRLQMKPRPCKQCLRNSNMICWGCYDLTVARRCMGQNLIPCFSFSFHYLLFLVCVQFTRNTGKVIPLFAFWRRVLSYLFTYCYIMDLEKNVFYSSCCILTMQVMLVPEYDLWIRVKPKSKYHAHTFSPRTNTIRSTSTCTSLSNLVGGLALLKIH